MGLSTLAFLCSIFPVGVMVYTMFRGKDADELVVVMRQLSTPRSVSSPTCQRIYLNIYSRGDSAPRPSIRRSSSDEQGNRSGVGSAT